MPGLNENLVNERNKKHRGMPTTKSGRADPDTPQNVVTTTTIMLPPPKSIVEDKPDAECYAPKSNNALADTPTRGDWALTTTDGRWMDLSLTYASGVNTYGNAVPVFTNMSRVPIGTKMRAVGIVGNAGMSKQGDVSKDNYGQVYSAGAVTGINTGPEKIEPCSLVYLSPYSYVRQDPQTGKPFPGYTDPGWDDANIDKYVASTHMIHDDHVPSLFFAIESDLREEAKKELTPGLVKKILAGQELHQHLPVYDYAKQFLYQARADYVMQEVIEYLDEVAKAQIVPTNPAARVANRAPARPIGAGGHQLADPAPEVVAGAAAAAGAQQLAGAAGAAAAAAAANPAEDAADLIQIPNVQKVVKALNDANAQTKEFWRKFYQYQDEFVNGLGVARSDGRREHALLLVDLEMPRSGLRSKEAGRILLKAVVGHQKLVRASHEIYKLQFCEQNNFIRSMLLGKARYGAVSHGQLDMLLGYGL